MSDDYDDEGLTLEDALRKFSPPEQYDKARMLWEAMEYHEDSDPVRYARLKMEWRPLRKALEAAFRAQLESGAFIVCGRESDGSWVAIDPRELRDAWIVYEHDVIHGDFIGYSKVRVFGVKSSAEIHAPRELPFSHEADYRHVTLNGVSHVLGEKQATIVKMLYEARREGDGWRDGKQLLTAAGSNSMRLSDLFKHQPGLIESDGRGLYRLRITSEK